MLSSYLYCVSMITPGKSRKWQENCFEILMIEELMQNWDNACNKQKMLVIINCAQRNPAGLLNWRKEDKGHPAELDCTEEWYCIPCAAIWTNPSYVNKVLKEFVNWYGSVFPKMLLRVAIIYAYLSYRPRSLPQEASIEKAEILWGNDNYCVSMRSVYSTVITTWYIMFGKSQIHKW